MSVWHLGVFYFRRLETCLYELLVLSWTATAIKRFSRAELCVSFLDIPQFQHRVAASRLADHYTNALLQERSSCCCGLPQIVL